MNALKAIDPLKYVKMMIAPKESSFEKKSFYGTLSQSSVSASEASYNDLLQQVKKTIFKYLFELLKKDFIGSFGIKKMISQINITACPTNVGEALIDIQNLIDQMCAELNRDVDAKSKL